MLVWVSLAFMPVPSISSPSKCCKVDYVRPLNQLRKHKDAVPPNGELSYRTRFVIAPISRCSFRDAWTYMLYHGRQLSVLR